MSRFNDTYSTLKSTTRLIHRYPGVIHCHHTLLCNTNYGNHYANSESTSGHDSCLPSQLALYLRKCWFNVGSKLEIPGQPLVSVGVTYGVSWSGDSGLLYCYTNILLVISKTIPIIVINSSRVRTPIAGPLN